MPVYFSQQGWKRLCLGNERITSTHLNGKGDDVKESSRALFAWQKHCKECDLTWLTPDLKAYKFKSLQTEVLKVKAVTLCTEYLGWILTCPSNLGTGSVLAQWSNCHCFPPGLTSRKFGKMDSKSGIKVFNFFDENFYLWFWTWLKTKTYNLRGQCPLAEHGTYPMRIDWASRSQLWTPSSRDCQNYYGRGPEQGENMTTKCCPLKLIYKRMFQTNFVIIMNCTFWQELLVYQFYFGLNEKVFYPHFSRSVLLYIWRLTKVTVIVDFSNPGSE